MLGTPEFLILWPTNKKLGRPYLITYRPPL